MITGSAGVVNQTGPILLTLLVIREINHISNPDIYDTQEPLVLLLELLLIKYLNREDAFLGRTPGLLLASFPTDITIRTYKSKLSFQ